MGAHWRSRIKGNLPGLRITIETRTTMLTAIAALVLLVGGAGMAWAQESPREADLPVFGVGAGQTSASAWQLSGTPAGSGLLPTAVTRR